MLPSQRVLAVLLCLAAAPSNAQVERVSAPSLLPASVVPASVGAAPLFTAPALSVLAAPSISVPALSVTPIPVLPAAAPALVAAPAAASVKIDAVPAPVAAPALDAAALPAPVDGPWRGVPGFPGTASRAGDPRLGSGLPSGLGSELGSGSKLFDGSGRFVTRSGSVFAPLRTATPAAGGVALVRVAPAPAAPFKAVPDTRGLFGAQLLDRISKIAAAGQIPHEYHEASKYLFSHADNHMLNGVRGVADAYSGVFIPGTSDESRDYAESGDQAHDGWTQEQRMNVEHVFPQSFFRKTLPVVAGDAREFSVLKAKIGTVFTYKGVNLKNYDIRSGLVYLDPAKIRYPIEITLFEKQNARSDLHHLMATLEHPNGMRGSYPFGDVKGAVNYSNEAGARRGGQRFEPPDFSKGRVARAMLYFYVRYRNEPFFKTQRAAVFWNSQAATMVEWNRRFPPTVEERARNDQVEAFQGNRNPFVDDRSLADRIGMDALRAPLPQAYDRTPAKRAFLAAPDSNGRRSDVRRNSDDRRSDKPRKPKRRKFHRSHGGRNRGGYRGY